MAAIVVECPYCRFRAVVVSLGQPVQCPGCRETWTPSAPAASVEPPSPTPAARPVHKPSPRREPELIVDAEPVPIGNASNGLLIGLTAALGLLVCGGIITAVVVLGSRADDKPSRGAGDEKPIVKGDPRPQPKPEPTPPGSGVPQLPPEPGASAATTTFTPEQIHQLVLKNTFLVFAQDGHGYGVLVHGGKRLVLTTDLVAEDGRTVTLLTPSYTSGTLVTDVAAYQRRQATSGLTAVIVARDTSRNLALVELEKLPTGVRGVGLASASPSMSETVHSMRGGLIVWQRTSSAVRGRGLRTEPYPRGKFDATAFITDLGLNAGADGAPVVNDRGHLVGVTSHITKGEPTTVLNTDVTEVRAFLKEYFNQIGETWTDPALPGGSNGSDVGNLTQLIAVVKAGEPGDRITAARRIGKLGAEAQSAIPALLNVAAGADADLEKAIGDALVRIGAPEAGSDAILLAALDSKSSTNRAYALRHLGASEMVSDDAIAPAVTALTDPSPDVRIAAAELLEKVGPKARPAALGPLLDRLADGNADVRKAAVAALKQLGPPGPEDQPILIKKLADANANVRTAAALAIEPLVTTADMAAEVWVPLLADESAELRLTALRGLLKFPEQLPKVSTSILALIEDPDKRVRVMVIGAAAHMRSVPGVANRVLTLFKSETDPELRSAAGIAAAQLTEPKSSDLELLQLILKDGSSPARVAAADKLAKLKADAAPAVPDLIARVGDGDPEVRAAALRTLAAIGPASHKAVPLAADLLNAKDAPPVVRDAAIDLLAVSGPDGLKVLKARVNQPLESAVNARLCHAFGTAGADARDMHPWMIDQAETVVACREPVAEALIRYGDDATIQVLLKRADAFKPSRVGEPPEAYPQSYRRWAVETLGKMKLEEQMTKATRERLFNRMKVLERDDDPDLAKAAAAVVKLLTR